MENGACGPPCRKPSAAASFMGCPLAILTPDWSPVPITMSPLTSPVTAAMRMLAIAVRTLRPRSKNQLLTATTNTAPVSQPLLTVCRNFMAASGANATAKKSVISLRTVSGLSSIPTGCCIQLFATRIHHAESVAPMPVSHVEARWNPRPTLSQPKNITPIKVLSIKNATMPSMASGAPKMSPTNHE